MHEDKLSREKSERRKKKAIEIEHKQKDERSRSEIGACRKFIWDNYEGSTFWDFHAEICDIHETDNIILCDECIEEVHQKYVSYIENAAWVSEPPRLLVYTEFLDTLFSEFVDSQRLFIASKKSDGENVAEDEDLLRCMLIFLKDATKPKSVLALKQSGIVSVG